MNRLIQVILITCFFLSNAYAEKQIHIERWKTTQGASVVFYQAMDVPMLDINIAFYAGSAYDGQHFGLSALTAELIDQGNDGIHANAIADQFAEVGAQFSTDSTRDNIVLSARTLSSPEALERTVHTLNQIISRPDFPETAFGRKKNQQLLRIKQTQESGDAVADETFYNALYQSHPYAHPVDGTMTTVNAIKLQDVQQFYKQFFTTKNTVIVIVGAIDKNKAVQMANHLVANLPAGKKATPIPAAKPLSEEINIEVPFDTTQTVLRLGQLGIHHHDKDYFSLLVGNYILGGGNLVSQLATELREKRGLTYGVYSQFASLVAEGPFLINLSTKKLQAATAEKLVRETLSAFIKKGPTSTELAAAKQYLVGSFPLSIASNQNMARLLLSMTIYELPNDYLDTYIAHIQAVSIQDIQRAFKRHINPSKLLNVQVGKE
jgi:zinc protease